MDFARLLCVPASGLLLLSLYDTGSARNGGALWLSINSESWKRIPTVNSAFIGLKLTSHLFAKVHGNARV